MARLRPLLLTALVAVLSVLSSPACTAKQQFHPPSLAQFDGKSWGGITLGTTTCQELGDQFETAGSGGIGWSTKLYHQDGMTVIAEFSSGKPEATVTCILIKYDRFKMRWETVEKEIGDTSLVYNGDCCLYPDKGIGLMFERHLSFLDANQNGYFINGINLFPPPGDEKAANAISDLPLPAMPEKHKEPAPTESHYYFDPSGMSGGLHLDDTACQALKDDAAALIAAAGQPIIVTMKPSGQYNEGQNTNVSLEIDITGNDGNGGCQTVRTVSDSFPIGRFDSIPKSPAFLTAEAGALYNAQKNIGILGTASATDSLTLACHDWNDLSWRIRFWSGQKLGQASAGIPFNRIWESPSEKVASL